MDHKSFARVEIKDAEKGEVSAVFATLDVIDSDGDVTVKGAFEDGASCVISAYGHQSWKGKLPVGKGRIRETKTEAIFDGRFFMDTIDGLDTFKVVKALTDDDGPGQEWSYGLVDMVTERGEFDGQKVRFIKSVRVPEVSPVLLGAGVNTRTLVAKARSLKTPNSETEEALRDAGLDRYGDDDIYVYPIDHDPDEGWVIYSIYTDGEADRFVKVSYTLNDDGGAVLADDDTDVERRVEYAPAKAQDPRSIKFTEHARSVIAGVSQLIDRTGEVIAYRSSQGKQHLPLESIDLLGVLDGDLKRLAGLMTAAPHTTDDEDDEVLKAYLAFVARTQGAT